MTVNIYSWKVIEENWRLFCFERQFVILFLILGKSAAKNVLIFCILIENHVQHTHILNSIENNWLLCALIGCASSWITLIRPKIITMNFSFECNDPRITLFRDCFSFFILWICCFCLFSSYSFFFKSIGMNQWFRNHWVRDWYKLQLQETDIYTNVTIQQRSA